MSPALPRLRFAWWSDPFCIWAFVAEDALDDLLAAHPDRLDVDHHVIPVFGSIPHRFAAGSWAAGGVPARVGATAKVAAAHGHPEVDGTVWEKVQPTSTWAVGAAIKLAFDAERAGDEVRGSGAAYQRALRRAFFVDARDISARGVQLEVAAEAGLDPDRLRAGLDSGRGLARVAEDEDERQRQRLQGSPTWVFDGGRAVLYGNVNRDVLRHTVADLLGDLAPGGSACG